MCGVGNQGPTFFLTTSPVSSGHDIFPLKVGRFSPHPGITPLVVVLLWGASRHPVSKGGFVVVLALFYSRIGSVYIYTINVYFYLVV